ncbi:MAG: hypothetical protein IKE91_03085 [Clostridia bacterium]|nr:hypothetical protein [Clostridia bacterium]
MNKVKEFRKRCEQAKTPWKRAAVVYSFLKEDLSEDVSIDIPERAKRRSIFHRSIVRKKTNAHIVLDELHRFVKKYKDFFIFATIAESPAIKTEDDLQKLFNIFIRELKSINHGMMDRASLKSARRFSSIMNDDNFTTLYLMFRNTAKLSTEKINSLVTELSMIDETQDNDTNSKAEEIRNQIFEERTKLGDDLLDPFFELLSETFNKIRNDNDTASDTKEKRIKRIFSLMYEDLPEFYEYVYSFNGPIKLFFDDPNNKKTPKDCINLYDFLMEINIFSFQSIGKREIVDFKNMVTGIKESFVPSLTWTNDEYKEFIDLCQKRDIDIPLAFSVIDMKKGSNTELDDIFNTFLEKHKAEYMEWCIYGEKGYYDYKFQDEAIYTDNDIKVYSIFVDELMKRQSNSNIRLIDIRNSETGSTSSVAIVGEYIIKSGLGRYEEKIPNHRRILQPIIRQYNENAFFEVADVVDMDVNQDELKQVFYELLNDGYAWVDPSKDNIGRLRRKNIPRQENPIDNTFDEMYSDEKATNMIGEINGDVLDKGECVIIDTDLVYDLRKISREKFNSIQFPPYMTKQMISDLKRKYEELHNAGNEQTIKQDIEGR